MTLKLCMCWYWQIRKLCGFPCDMLFAPSHKRNLCTYRKMPTYFETWTRAYSYWNEEFIIPRSDLCIFDCSSSSSHDASGIPHSISRLILLHIFLSVTLLGGSMAPLLTVINSQRCRSNWKCPIFPSGSIFAGCYCSSKGLCKYKALKLRTQCLRIIRK